MKGNGKYTLDAILAVMKRGQWYTAHDLSRRAGLPVTTARLILGSDRAVTAIDTRRGRGRGREFCVAGTGAGPRHVDTRIRPDFTSHLKGYQAWLDGHQALAMLARGGATIGEV